MSAASARPKSASRYAPVVRWVSLGLIAAGALLIVRKLPLASLLPLLEDWIKGLGVWGPVVFAIVYVLAVLLFVPASALTIAAGAMFGVATGTIVVSAASTTAAALAFLIARYLARDAIARKVKASAKLSAVDRAIGEGGWKVVGLLRLSPAVPFTLQNYLYGVTRVPFWVCVPTSWVAMLPGTLLYVYLGQAGRAGVEAASGDRGRTPAEWALLGVGLLATVVVTVYVTHLARKALKQSTAGTEPNQTSVSEGGGPSEPERRPRGTTVAAGIALAVLGVAAFAQFDPAFERFFAGLAGPPRVTLREVYEEKPGGPAFDHAVLDELLRGHVGPGGWVDYPGLQQDAARLDAYLGAVANAPFDEMGRNERLALLINAYNAFTLRLILDHYPVNSIVSIPPEERWEAMRWTVGGHVWSLSQIEHEQIRPKFKEPRVHFALVRAAVGCPPLRREAYQAGRLDEQLADQARYVHSHARWFRLGPDERVVYLTSLYRPTWYGSDFKQAAGSALDFAALYAPELKRALDEGRRPRIKWLDYDWALNGKENAR